MSAKELKFRVDGRNRMLRDLDILANSMKLGPKGTTPCLTRRRHDRRTRVRGLVRKDGRPVDVRSRLQVR